MKKGEIMTIIEQDYRLIYDNFRKDCCLRYDKKIYIKQSYQIALNHLEKLGEFSSEKALFYYKKYCALLQDCYQKTLKN